MANYFAAMNQNSQAKIAKLRSEVNKHKEAEATQEEDRMILCETTKRDDGIVV